MRLVAGFLAIAWGLACGVPAIAADKNPLEALGFKIVEPLTPEKAAQVRARVDETLKQTGQAQAFDNISDRNGGSVRHRESGLICPLGQPGQTASVETTGTVVCRTKEGGGQFELRLARAAPGSSLESVAAATAEELSREPGYKAYRGTTVTAHPEPGSPAAPHRTFRFTSRAEGKARFTTVRVGVIDRWVLTERSTAANANPGDQLGMGEIMAETMFGSNLKGSNGGTSSPAENKTARP